MSKEFNLKKYSNQITFILFAAVVIYFGASIKSNSINFHDDLQKQAVDLLTNLGVLVLVIERALEVYANIWFKKDRIPLDTAATKSDKNLDLESKKYVDGKETDKTKLNEAIDEEGTSKTELGNYKIKTMTATLRVSFIIGVIISIAGFRVLDSLFISEGITGIQLRIYNYTDILLTAGILAGGSNGIHALSTTLGAFFENSKGKLRNAGRSTNKD
jgi:hypothetical protein